MRILLVEDDENLSQSLQYQLEQQGFPTDVCFDGEEALYYIEQQIHDCILLDRMIPCLDGSAVLSRMRDSGNATPVILITALGTLKDKVEGLNLGADDYLVKPFALEELIARIHSVTRRPRILNSAESICFGDLALDKGEHLLKGPKASCSLSIKESLLFEALLRNPGQTLTRETLLIKVWGPESEVEDGNLDNYIHFLRRRLRTVGSITEIKTVRGLGYRLNKE